MSKFEGKIAGWNWGVLVVLALPPIGCGGGTVAVGQESPAVNLSRCYGESTDCGRAAQQIVSELAEVDRCPDQPAGVIKSELVFEDESTSWNIRRVEVAGDGTVWTLSSRSGGSDSRSASSPDLRLAAYSPYGVLLGERAGLAPDVYGTLYSGDLAVDADGNALFALYSNYVPDADAEFLERLSVQRFDQTLEPIGEPWLFRELGGAFLFASQDGTFTLAGAAADARPAGYIARVEEAGEPHWIQTNVPGTGVTAAGVTDDGFTLVASPRSRTRFGVTRFDTQGNPVWDLPLPNEFVNGYGLRLAHTSSGGAVVVGTFGEAVLLAREISAEGSAGRGFLVENHWNWGLDADPASGDAYVSAASGVVRIRSQGSSCELFSIPTEPDAIEQSPGEIAIANGAIYFVMQDKVHRARLPK
jgi:hypothetical protein